jgi:hypothetical protein
MLKHLSVWRFMWGPTHCFKSWRFSKIFLAFHFFSVTIVESIKLFFMNQFNHKPNKDRVYAINMTGTSFLLGRTSYFLGQAENIAYLVWVEVK